MLYSFPATSHLIRLGDKAEHGIFWHLLPALWRAESCVGYPLQRLRAAFASRDALAAATLSSFSFRSRYFRRRRTTRRKVVLGLAAGLAVTCIVCGGTTLAIAGFESFITSVRNLAEIPSPTARAPTLSTALSTPLVTYHGHANDVTSVSWSPNGKRIASGSYDDETVQVWSAE